MWPEGPRTKASTPESSPENGSPVTLGKSTSLTMVSGNPEPRTMSAKILYLRGGTDGSFRVNDPSPAVKIG